MIRLRRLLSQSFFQQITLLLFLGAVVFGNVLQNGFVMDDESEIVQNNLVHSLDHLKVLFQGSTMATDGTSALGGIYYRPAMMSAFAFIWSACTESGDGASASASAWFHAVQLLVHVANAILILLIFRALVSEWWAFSVAVLFLVHPINVEAVAYSASLQDPLFVFFGLLALLASVRRECLDFWSTSILAICFLLSLLSKETGALLILLALASRWVFHRGRSWVQVTVAIGVAAVIYASLRFGYAHLSALTDPTSLMGRADWQTRLLTVPLALWVTLAKFFFPMTLTVTQDWAVTSLSWHEVVAPLIADILILGGLSFLVVKKSRADRRWVFLWIWVLMPLTLHSHVLVPVDGTVAERWFYLTSIAGIGLIVLAASETRMLRRRPRTVAATAIVLTLVFAGRSWMRVQDWRDGYTLYGHDVELQPNSFDLQNNFGVELFRRGKIDEAAERFQRSIALYPQWTVNWNNLGAVFENRGDLQKAESCYLHSVEAGTYLLAYENYLKVLLRQNRQDEARKFLEERALPVFPGSQSFAAVLAELKRRATP